MMRARKRVDDATLSHKPTWDIFKEAMARKYWTSLYIECNGNMNQVARISGTNRTHAYKVMTRLGVGAHVRDYSASWNVHQTHERADVSS
jgi:transcriptional regulator of acetoin/glycerol metabolism